MRVTFMNAPGAVTSPTELRRAVEHRRSNPRTPLDADAWERLLAEAGILNRFSDIPAGLRKGFIVDIPTISSTHAPFNSSTLLSLPSQYISIILHEFEQGRYIGPFSRTFLEEIIGPFQTSPLSLVPKPHKPDAFRLVQNFSYPYHPSDGYTSINYHINSTDFPCTWGTFSVFANIVCFLPPGSQACVRDVKEAYRTIPLHPTQWPGTVVRLGFRDEDEFALDTNECFGISSHAGDYGRKGDGANEIMRSKGIGPVTKWVDDNIFVRVLRCYLAEYNDMRSRWRVTITRNGGLQKSGGRLWYSAGVLPNDRPLETVEDMSFPLADLSGRSPRSSDDMRFCYNTADIDWISDQLQIPWQLEKDSGWSETVTYLGFDWDLGRKVVSLTAAKREKYRAAIAEWQGSRSHDKREAERLYGKLLHASQVLPAGRAYLTSLEYFICSFRDSPFQHRSPPRRLRGELDWWSQQLASARSISRRVPGRELYCDLAAFSDASSGVSIGISIRGFWRAWSWVDGWRTLGGEKRDIGWAEAVGFELLVRTLIRFDHHSAFRVFGDNQGVIEGWANGRSRNFATNTVFRRVHDLLKEHDIDILLRYVPGSSNPADGPSRGLFPPDRYLLPDIQLPSSLVDLLIPVHSSAGAARRNYGGALPKPSTNPQRIQELQHYLAGTRQQDELALTSHVFGSA